MVYGFHSADPTLDYPKNFEELILLYKLTNFWGLFGRGELLITSTFYFSSKNLKMNKNDEYKSIMKYVVLHVNI